VRDAATVAALVATSALRRRETRGSHVRLDHPGSAPDERRSFVTLAEVERAGRSA
jgi:aspartate oxidase